VNQVYGLLLMVMLAAFSCSRLAAQELEPRSFNNVPIGQTFMAVVAGRSEGDLSPTPSSPLKDAELRIDAGAIALSHTFSLAGDSAKFDVAFSRLCYEGSAIFRGEYVEDRRCEYGDPRVKLTWNFYGAPALALQDFASWDSGLVIGASLGATIPAGTYNSEHLINAGTNRWSIKPKVGMSQRIGRWQWELTAGATLFEDNDDFFNGILVEQDPLYAFSGHLIYNFRRGWLSLDANYFFGGESTQDGVEADDRQDNSRWGVTWSRPVGRRHLIKLYASTGVVTRVGNDFDNYGVGWVYRF
jgi:Putative MetA-pathway of phenol degradation